MPKIAHGTAADVTELDAILAIVPRSPAKSLFEQLPESERWQGLNARSLSTSKMARPGTVRTTVLANRRQTLAVLGYMGAEASAFEKLALAGRMLKEVSSRCPGSIGLVALGDEVETPGGVDALLAAALASAFQMPAFRSRDSEDATLQRLTLLDAAKVDIP
ncbi:MAG: hypothetical protein JWO52_1289, partial [Gammaproteobacteria bacterium]|nr:hypothetical protein [Gammaproteobacteria bacterium]